MESSLHVLNLKIRMRHAQDDLGFVKIRRKCIQLLRTIHLCVVETWVSFFLLAYYSLLFSFHCVSALDFF